jgi:hypothetical protein
MRWITVSDALPADASDPSKYHEPAPVLAMPPEQLGGVLIEASSWETALQWASALRAHPVLVRLPLYLAQRPFGNEPALAEALFDGVGTAADMREREATEILANGERLASAPGSAAEGLAQYLACRPGRRLVPIRDWKARSYYRYPIVEALLGADEDSFVWLERWSRRRILDIDMTSDRLRVCDQCGSSHQNYVDVCPNCASIDIATTQLLHCFTCGNVDQQSNFQRHHMLECPKCHTVLRHIGVDYDRPIEQQQCHQCKHLFVDANVRSECMDCGAGSTPEQLPVRPINIYRLGGAGVLLARQGNLSPVLSGLDTVNFIAPALFERLVDWQIRLARRYPGSHFFCVIGLKMHGLDKLVEAIGRAHVATLVDGFAERLRAALRDTDLTTRGDEDHIWLLAPHTDEKGGRFVLDRILGLAQVTQQADESRLQVAATLACVPGHAALPQEANQLMGLMAGRLEAGDAE